MSGGLYSLSQKELDFYEKNGYIIIKKLFDTALLEEMKHHFIDICEGRVKTGGGLIREHVLVGKKARREEYVLKIQDIFGDKVFAKYYNHPQLVQILSQFVGNDITGLNPMLINKPPGSLRHPTHQDGYYFPIKGVPKAVGVWTAIDPATVDNGCLYMLPGTHKNGLYKHVLFKNSKKFFHLLEDEDTVAPPNMRVYCEMEPGDTIFFHTHLLHGSGPNVTKNFRKCMTMHFIDTKSEFVDVSGTIQEPLLKEYRETFVPKGMPTSYAEYWSRHKSIIIAGQVPSRL